MTIFILAAFASCVSALAALILVGLGLFNTLRSIQQEWKRYHKLDTHYSPMARPLHLQEQGQEQFRDSPNNS